MRQPLLFLPGPMQVPDHVRVAADRPLFSQFSPQMPDLLSRLEAGCRPLFGTRSDVLFVASSGTGAMESAICNLTSPGDEIIVAVGGTFAQRWAEIAAAHRLTVRMADVDWRTGATVDDVERALTQWPAADVVFVTWSESSTGVLIPLDEIGRRVRSRGKILVADAVSGVAVSPMAMDDWKVDAAVAGSQKGLMLPPGLGIVAVGPRGWDKSQRSTTSRFYWDWKKYRGAVPWTPALSLLFQLDASLAYIQSQTLEQIFTRRAHVAEAIRGLVRRSGMEVYALNPGNGVTSVIPPPGFDIGGFRQRLETDFGIHIAAGPGPLQRWTFRIGHVGHVTDEEVEYFIRSFESALGRRTRARRERVPECSVTS